MVNGDAPSEVVARIGTLLDQFIQVVSEKVQAAKARGAMVRSMLPCSTINILDASHLYVAAQKSVGVFGGGLAVIHLAAASRSTPQAILWTPGGRFPSS
jgi:hypothetical protein